MHVTRVHLIVSATAVATALVTPPAADAAKYRFKVVDFKLEHKVKWQTVYRDTYCEDRSSADYYEHSGTGFAALVSNDYLRRGRVTFKTSQGHFLPARIDGRPFEGREDLRGAFAYRGANSDWTVTFRDDPDSDCVPPDHLGQPDTSCAKEQDPKFDAESWPGGMLQMSFLLFRGRLQLTGGYYPFDPDRTCSDPSQISAVVSPAQSPRTGLGKLIRDEDVRRIRLKAFKEGRIPASRLVPGGSTTKSLGGDGATYTAKWSMTLVRRR